MARTSDGGSRKGRAPARPQAKVRPPKKVPKAVKAGYLPPKKEKYVPPKEEKGGGYIPEEPEVPEPGEPEVPEPPVTGGQPRPAPFSLGGAGWAFALPGAGGGAAPLRSPYTGAASAEEAAREAGGYTPYTAPARGGIKVGRYVDRYGRPTAAGAGGRAPAGAPAMGGEGLNWGYDAYGNWRPLSPYEAQGEIQEMGQAAAGAPTYPPTQYMAPERQPHMPYLQYGPAGSMYSWFRTHSIEDWAEMVQAHQYDPYSGGMWRFFTNLAEKYGKLTRPAVSAGAEYGGYGGYGGGGGGGGGGWSYTRAPTAFSLGLVNWRIG